MLAIKKQVSCQYNKLFILWAFSAMEVKVVAEVMVVLAGFLKPVLAMEGVEAKAHYFYFFFCIHFFGLYLNIFGLIGLFCLPFFFC
jgi:hypothetical protein